MKWLLIILLLAATTAQAEIYTWIDRQGTAHYTNSLADVPERYRAKVKVLKLGPEPSAATPPPPTGSGGAVLQQQPAPPVPATPATARPPAEERRAGRAKVKSRVPAESDE